MQEDRKTTNSQVQVFASFSILKVTQQLISPHHREFDCLLNLVQFESKMICEFIYFSLYEKLEISNFLKKGVHTHESQFFQTLQL